MTTLCLCDWVESSADRERRLNAAPGAGLTDLRAIASSAAGRAMPIPVARLPSIAEPSPGRRLLPMPAIATLLLGASHSGTPPAGPSATAMPTLDVRRRPDIPA